tara:strand:+ start:1340 stop:2380 length:1041 start_codon:yes stop_codon:yes gene_type:complete
MKIKAYGSTSPDSDLAELSIIRRDMGNDDLLIEILYCGICHSDIHMAHDEWGMSAYPIVPGHEIIGKVISAGKNVSRFKVDSIVGVGCMVGSCHQCPACDKNMEQFCPNMVMTFGSPDPFIAGQMTYGGYSTHIVVPERFVLRVGAHLDLTRVAPLLCAGITTYSPMKQWEIGKNSVIGIIGLGGLGHMGVKFGKAMGAHVTVITSTESKKSDALALGADEAVILSDDQQMKKYVNHFDFLLDTTPVLHDINPYLQLLKFNKTLALVGAAPVSLHSMNLIFGKKHVSGSLIGGVAETQEMLDYCAEHNILADTELITVNDINSAYERVINSDIKYRFVIDMASLKH